MKKSCTDCLNCKINRVRGTLRCKARHWIRGDLSDKVMKLTPKEISELIEAEFFSMGETPKQRAAKVGWAIKKFNLSSEKKSRTKEGVRYLFEKTKVEAVCKSYFKTELEYTSLAQPASAVKNQEQIAEVKMV